MTAASTASPGKKLRVVCVAVPFDPSTDQILMVSSRKHPDMFILPKGGWEKKLGESLAEAARREAGEEAGIVSPPFPTSPAPSPILTTSDATTLFHFFPLPVLSLSPTFLEQADRAREWVSYDEALGRVDAWAAAGGKTKKKAHHHEAGRVRKGELREGLEAWRAWRDGPGRSEEER